VRLELGMGGFLVYGWSFAAFCAVFPCTAFVVLVVICAQRCLAGGFWEVLGGWVYDNEGPTSFYCTLRSFVGFALLRFLCFTIECGCADSAAGT
jgi:hypothetical protein